MKLRVISLVIKTTAAQVTRNNKIVQFDAAAYLRAARLSWGKTEPLKRAE